MKYAFITILSLFICLIAESQIDTVEIGIFKIKDDDNWIKSFTEFTQPLKHLLDASDSPKVLHDIIPFESGYDINILEHKSNSIIEISAGVYLENRDTINKYFLKEFLAIKTFKESAPFYPGHFISSKKSTLINDIKRSDFQKHIKTVYYVNSLSSSGYVVPLNKLYDDGVITAPSIIALQKLLGETGKTVMKCSQEGVIKSVIADTSSIGFVGYIDDKYDSSVKILLNFDNIPEDIIFFSRDLCKKNSYPIIRKWFEENFTVNYKNNKKSVDNVNQKRIFDLLAVVDYKKNMAQYENGLKSLSKKNEKVTQSKFSEYYEDANKKKLFWISISVYLILYFYIPISHIVYYNTTENKFSFFFRFPVLHSKLLYAISVVFLIEALRMIIEKWYNWHGDAFITITSIFVAIFLSTIFELIADKSDNILKKLKEIIILLSNTLDKINRAPLLDTGTPPVPADGTGKQSPESGEGLSSNQDTPADANTMPQHDLPAINTVNPAKSRD